MVKIQRWEEKLCNALVDPKESTINERFIEAQLIFYYQRMDTQDLVAAVTISDIEDGHLLLSDLGLRALFAIYCAKGKDFDQFVFKNQKISLKKRSKVLGIQTEDFQTLLYMYNNKGNNFK